MRVLLYKWHEIILWDLADFNYFLHDSIKALEE